MLSKKDKTSKDQPVNGALNVLGEGTVIEGNISSSGDLRIDGEIKGNLRTQGKCVLGSTGKISGDIEAKCCDISGLVEGNMRISDLLLIKNTGRINGDISTNKIVIENGGELNGSCTMGGTAPKSLKPGSSDGKSAKA